MVIFTASKRLLGTSYEVAKQNTKSKEKYFKLGYKEPSTIFSVFTTCQRDFLLSETQTTEVYHCLYSIFFNNAVPFLIVGIASHSFRSRTLFAQPGREDLPHSKGERGCSFWVQIFAQQGGWSSY